MSAIIIAHFKAQEGKLAEMAEVFKASLGATRGFEGCIGLDVYVEESADTYTLIEEWESVAHYDTYLQWRIDTGIKEATARIIEGGWDNGVTIQRLGSKLDI